MPFQLEARQEQGFTNILALGANVLGSCLIQIRRHVFKGPAPDAEKSGGMISSGVLAGLKKPLIIHEVHEEFLPQFCGIHGHETEAASRGD